MFNIAAQGLCKENISSGSHCILHDLNKQSPKKTKQTIPDKTLSPSNQSNQSTSEKLLSNHKLNSDFLAKYEQPKTELGCGGFGFVVSSICLETKTQVAVKFIFKEKATHSFSIDPKYGKVPTEVFILHQVL